MCGIWALVNNNNISDISEYLKSFWNIKHRGPDNSHFETFENVYVGFHRLAIMDTSFKSNQPYVLIDKDGSSIVFICNGEIYNYKELDKKYDLNVGTSDCLTIPKLYLELGEEEWLKLFGTEIKGEYAFCMFKFDHMKKLKTYYVGRDSIGIRPLYQGTDIDIYCSEIKGIPKEINVKEFTPGQIKIVDCNLFNNTTDYYIFNYDIYGTSSNIYNEDIICKSIRKTVYNSIERRLDADRPIAFLLSGGVDSSLVCSISSRILGQNIRTFCCGIEGSTDIEKARLVAKHINSNHTEILFTEEEGLKYIDDVIYTTETWDTTTIRASVGQYIVSKYISENTDCKVVLVGEGPDEVCSSYLFNFYAPSGDELHQASKDYVKEIHMYDGRRADRCVSRWGLECRIPFLDPEFIKSYWSIKTSLRMPTKYNFEKYWLRKSFDELKLLPDQILWRKKEAFSDGVSSKKKSWYQIIQDHLMEKYGMTEQEYYKKKFIEYFGENRVNVLPHYWQPKWDSNGEVKEYVDPSARCLNVYNE